MEPLTGEKGLTVTLNSMVLTIQVLAYVKVEDQQYVVINDIDLMVAGSHGLLTTTTTVLRPFFRATRVSRCQKRTSGLGAIGDEQRQTH